MDDLTRRGALALAATAGVAAWAAGQAGVAEDKDKPKPMTDQQRALDRKRIIAAGLTEDEADCWELVAPCAEKLFALPKLHVMDDHELSHAIHVLQYRLLSRPTYRRYLEQAKAKKK